MSEPTGWAAVAPALRALTMLHDVAFEVIAPEARPRVVAASGQAAKARGYDMMYRDELDWWTGHTDISEGSRRAHCRPPPKWPGWISHATSRAHRTPLAARR